jgi:glutamate N-acetyltransferase/amino-acid N-acetyltransferase
MSAQSKDLSRLHPVPGIRLGTACAGIKKPDRRDLVIIEIAPDSTCAAVFTRNAFCAAPVTVARAHMAAQTPRYLLINTGNANAGTGAQGLRDAQICCDTLAQLTGAEPTQILPFSTGVIGELLPVTRLCAGLPEALAALDERGWELAAQGIMTTDTRPKGASRQLTLQGRTITVTGIAKGSGMIRPDMATMLAYVATDAGLDSACLQRCLNEAVDASFNRITVDGDTSTNDACLLIATGRSGVEVVADDEDYPALSAAVREVCIELAQAIVRDGEGATKFITIDVRGGRDEAECKLAAYAIAHSPLVKTAFFASDPNWGRILAAVGRAGIADLVIERVVMHLDDVCIVRDGGRAPDYQEADGQRVMQRDAITIRIELGRGAAQTQVWTCDLSHDYVRINAEYRT